MSTALQRFIRRHNKLDTPIKHQILPEGSFLYEGINLINGKKVPKSSAQLRLEAGILRIIQLKSAGLWLEKSPIEEQRWPSIGPIRPIIGGESGMGFVDSSLLNRATRNVKFWDRQAPNVDDVDDVNGNVSRKFTAIEVFSFKPEPSNWINDFLKFLADRGQRKKDDDEDQWGDIFNDDDEEGD